jgi:hypothetical protein
MRRCISLLLVSLLSCSGFAQLAQETKPAAPPPQQPATAAAQETKAPTPPAPVAGKLVGFGLEDATPVKLRIARTVSSAEAKVGEVVDFEVLEEVRVGDVLIIPKGGIAWATVTEAQAKRRMGRGGKLNMNIDSVRLVNGQKVPLRAVKDVQGGGHVGAMTGAIVATTIVFFPAAPFFLFMHGKDITIPKGTEITAYINGDTPLQKAEFLPKEESKPAVVEAAAAPSAQSVLDISSTPAGADIEIDGNFAGNTPSAINVTTGEHSVKITKRGFQSWERKLQVTGGSVKIAPELEPETKPN